MAVHLTDSDMEQGLIQLAEAQPVPASKHAMGLAILRHAVGRFRTTGDPNAWMHGSSEDRAPIQDQRTNESVSTSPTPGAATPASDIAA